MKQNLLFLIFTVLGCATIFAQSEKETIARNWLEDNKNELNIQDNHNLDMQFSRAGLSGETFRFYQMINGVQIFNAEITVHVSNRNNVTFHATTYDSSIETISTTPAVTEEQALEIALTNLNVEAADVTNIKNELYILKNNNQTILTRRVLVSAYTKTGAWEVMLNAQTGAVISAKDVALYNHKKDKKDKDQNTAKTDNSSIMMATGTGFVFESDPLTATTSLYGGQYVDNNDNTNAALDAARSSVTLLDIELSGGNYRLTGPYADIAELGAPNKGLFIQTSSDFSFNRQQDGFEAVNVYYHLDNFLRYLNVDLGLSVAPSGNGGVVRFDAHGANGEDQSFYNPGSQSVQFGEGCVDDGEDADVIVHEVGHGVHDWITNGATSPFLGEGNGDYLAGSYKRSFGQWSASDASYSFMFGWDGHNPCWGGRTTADTRVYPGGLVGLQGGAAHNDGQMWASTLMEVWDIVGREKTDKAFIEGIAMTNNGTNQQDAAIAVRQAAIDMGTAGGYTCADIQAFTDRFTARGYTLPAYTCNLSVDEFTANSISIYPNPTQGVITLKNINQDYNVAVFNMLGQRVKDLNVNARANTMDVSNLATGAYFIKFNGVDTVLKFIKE
ncbi:T9SS type A sorting domain-containing protein [Lacinutrix jangbogonensis]|uniref:T9SS type A sorting domain-containing protein n=1 Tax=Lacinutrix jangbogonensis TaxID=1469557 RepID=UPI000690202B|nr:T9SS type A sorting domain-containing protein [Lacinutrix jangbogonensis]